MNPDADDTIVSCGFSAAEIVYMFLLPDSATTLFYLNAIVTPLSSIIDLHWFRDQV